MNAKSRCLRAISAYLGVTEPAMYGINLKYRFPMLCAMIGSGLAGSAVRPERRYGEWYRRRRPAGNPLDSAELLAGVTRMAMAIAVVSADCPHHRGIYQRKYRLGTLADCLTSSFGARLRPLAFAGIT